ncbi:ribose transport system permease protein [Pseudoxanthobacter soli DSM 19599]|uniref:Ribose transport system permease protein n=1 Tax=Pseudoxanthobacter soli DSM 19599 TaxID=1123029 RepID=A0A1M7ZPD1_9HYPH|nr:ABC transporter permease [Pseudoxanthobacter soli]SHO66526.1 ribose transport system permease protein [Pseudoxanthobacter soli DSM 19599]
MQPASTNTAPKALATAPSQNDRSGVMLTLLRRWGTIIVIVLVGVLFAVLSPYFGTVSNFNNILFSMIVSALVSMGLTFVVRVGSFDLSIGVTVTTTSIVVALLIPMVGAPLAIVGGLAAACVVGLVNGVLVTYGRLSGIVTTLGVMFLLGGVNQYLTGGYQVAVDYGEAGFRYIGQGRVGPIAFPVILLAVVFVIGHILATRSKVGHYISAVGDNPMAAYYSGLTVYRWVIVSFVLSALFSGIGGVILTSISTSAQPVGGQGYLLEAFAAVFLGATILGKGKPHLLGTLLGVFFLYMVSSGMNMVGISYATRQLFNGLVLLVAVGANAMLNREEIHLKFI